jgi:hypothetical protein
MLLRRAVAATARAGDSVSRHKPRTRSHGLGLGLAGPTPTILRALSTSVSANTSTSASNASGSNKKAARSHRGKRDPAPTTHAAIGAEEDIETMLRVGGVNKQTLALIQTVSEVDASLRAPASVDLDALIGKLKYLHTHNFLIPRSFFVRAIDVCAHRHDALRIELLIKLCQTNFDSFSSHIVTATATSTQTHPHTHDYLHTHSAQSRSRNVFNAYSSVVSHAISRLMRGGAVDAAMTLWTRMHNNNSYAPAIASHLHTHTNTHTTTSTNKLQQQQQQQVVNSSFITNKQTLEATLARMSAHAFPLSVIEQVHTLIAGNRWHHHVSAYYPRLFACWDTHVRRFPDSMYASGTANASFESHLVPAVKAFRGWCVEAERLLTHTGTDSSPSGSTQSHPDTGASTYYAHKLSSLHTAYTAAKRYPSSSQQASSLLSELEADMAQCFNQCVDASAVANRATNFNVFTQFVSDLKDHITASGKDSAHEHTQRKTPVVSVKHASTQPTTAAASTAADHAEKAALYITHLVATDRVDEAFTALNKLLTAVFGDEHTRAAALARLYTHQDANALTADSKHSTSLVDNSNRSQQTEDNARTAAAGRTNNTNNKNSIYSDREKADTFFTSQAKLLETLALKARAGTHTDTSSNGHTQTAGQQTHTSSRHAHIVSTLCTQMMGAFNSASNGHPHSVEQVNAFAKRLLATAQSHLNTQTPTCLHTDFHAAWISALHQPSGRYSLDENTETNNANTGSITDVDADSEIDALLGHIFDIIDPLTHTPTSAHTQQSLTVDPHAARMQTLIHAIVDTLCYGQTFTPYAFQKAATLALHTANTHPTHIAMDTFARLLRASAELQNVHEHGRFTARIDRMFAARVPGSTTGNKQTVNAATPTPATPVKASTTSAPTDREKEDKEFDLNNFIQTLIDVPTHTAADSKQPVRNLSHQEHLQPHTHPGYLMARLFAHSRLDNGLVCLQTLQQLREATYAQAVSVQTSSHLRHLAHTPYHQTLQALYHWRPATDTENDVFVRSPQTVVAYFLQTMSKDEVFGKPATVCMLLRLFGRAARDSRITGTQQAHFAARAVEFVDNLCVRTPTNSSTNSTNSSDAGNSASTHYMGHPKVPLTLEIVKELAKVCCMEGNVELAHNVIADYQRAHKQPDQPSGKSKAKKTKQEPTSKEAAEPQLHTLYEPIVFYQAYILGNLTAAEDLITQYVTNKGHSPTAAMVDAVIGGFERYTRLPVLPDKPARRSRHELADDADHHEDSNADTNNQNPDASDEAGAVNESDEHAAAATADADEYFSHKKRPKSSKAALADAQQAAVPNMDVVDWTQRMYTQFSTRPSPKVLRLLLESALRSRDVYESKRVVCLIEQLYTREERDQCVSVDDIDVSLSSNNRSRTNYFMKVESMNDTMKRSMRTSEGQYFVWMNANPGIEHRVRTLNVANGAATSNNNDDNRQTALLAGLADVEGVHVGALSNQSLQALFSKHGLQAEMIEN